METDQVVLDLASPPLLLPVAVGLRPSYVISGNLSFGWEKGQFKIERLGAMRVKRLLSEPVTDRGWATIWATMVGTYPALAAEVARRTAVDIQRADRQALRQEAEQQQKAELDEEVLVATVTECVLLGGHGYDTDFRPDTRCTLYFTERGIRANVEDSWIPQFRRSYGDTTQLEFSGPGVVKSGGRFVAAGFGLTGAAEAMIVSSILNKLTTRTRIHTMIRYQATDLEAFFFHSVETPEQLRIRLSGVLGRIRSGAELPPASASTDRLVELEGLGKLYQDGVLTADEFAAMKRKIIGGC